MSAENEKLMQCGEKSYTHDALMRIGNNAASIWGGSCISFEVQNGSIIFQCIEHGEFFGTSVTFDELEEYDK